MLDPQLAERLDYELGVIGKMGYDGYFLIVADFINWGKNQGIIFGPGRGSAAGSIVAYVMNITDLDPIKYDLLFERFLNPDRISMPDIDIDIQDTRRGEVIDYVTEKYGQERVAQIITFGTMAARNAVRDTGRVLGYPTTKSTASPSSCPSRCRAATSRWPSRPASKKAKALSSRPRPRRRVPATPRQKAHRPGHGARRHHPQQRRARGRRRHRARPIVNYVPLQRAQKGGIPLHPVLHGLRRRARPAQDGLPGPLQPHHHQQCPAHHPRVYGKSIDIAQIPLDDPKTFEAPPAATPPASSSWNPPA
jgi:DNA polymerase-3 subunit alpha